MIRESRDALASTLLFGPALVWSLAAIAGLGWTLADTRAWAEIDRHGDRVAGSDSCRSCHPDQWRSWHASFHRTMTQAVGPGGVDQGPLGVATKSATPTELLAPFAGEQLDYAGFRATMTRSASGQPRVHIIRIAADESGDPGEPGDPGASVGPGASAAVLGETVLDVEVALSVGSHRYQQYVAYLDRGGGPGELWRLPVAWHRAEQRWIHLNGAFVEPEGEIGSLPDYERHLSRWNDNCVFCHNTEPAPGLSLAAETPEFQTQVGELGIACEACHGPAEAHLARHRGNPLRRLLADHSPGDGSITHPEALDAGRESAICGRCHGQRIARDIATVMGEGDGFVPGDRLADLSRPIFADTTIAGVDGLDQGAPFATRFWPDGTPRLSAYEYQGLLSSPCYVDSESLRAGGARESGESAKSGGLGCGHCHDMHGDQPDGQLRAGRAGQGACVDCHDPAELGGAANPGGHGGHGGLGGRGGLGGLGGHDGHGEVDCLGCHMPAISYGLLEGMISHRISSPDPAAWIGRQDQPDACTQCHVDRSRSWAAGAMAQLGLHGSAPASIEPPRERLASRVVLDLLGGDPIQRNLAAHALGSESATGSVEDRLAWLADALEDGYPSVRWFAWRAMRSLAEREADAALLADLAEFDYLSPIDARIEVVTRIRARVGPAPLSEHPELREQLFDEREGLAIWIGE